MPIEFFMCGYEGKDCDPYALTSDDVTQRILLLINSIPMDSRSIANRLGISIDEVDKRLEELTRCGLVKAEGSVYRPSFAIYTIEDQKILSKVIDVLSSDIVDIVESYIPRVDSIINELTIVERSSISRA